MDISKIRRHALFVPVLWAFFLHLLFVLVAMFVVLHTTLEVPQAEFLNFKVKSVDTHALVQSYHLIEQIARARYILCWSFLFCRGRITPRLST